MASTAGRLTYRDLLQMPEDGPRYELIDGEAAIIPSPGADHQEILLELAVALRHAARSGASGCKVLIAPLDVVLAEDTVLQPDLLVIGPGSRARVERVVKGPPDLVVELLSPTSERRDRGVKRATYARFGVGEYWLVDPERRTIEVYRLQDGPHSSYLVVRIYRPGELVTTPLLPALALDPATLFAAPA